jgi:hypothetical protein
MRLRWRSGLLLGIAHPVGVFIGSGQAHSNAGGFIHLAWKCERLPYIFSKTWI